MECGNLTRRPKRNRKMRCRADLYDDNMGKVDVGCGGYDSKAPSHDQLHAWVDKTAYTNDASRMTQWSEACSQEGGGGRDETLANHAALASGQTLRRTTSEHSESAKLGQIGTTDMWTPR